MKKLLITDFNVLDIDYALELFVDTNYMTKEQAFQVRKAVADEIEIYKYVYFGVYEGRVQVTTNSYKELIKFAKDNNYQYQEVTLEQIFADRIRQMNEFIEDILDEQVEDDIDEDDLEELLAEYDENDLPEFLENDEENDEEDLEPYSLNKFLSFLEEIEKEFSKVEKEFKTKKKDSTSKKPKVGVEAPEQYLLSDGDNDYYEVVDRNYQLGYHIPAKSYAWVSKCDKKVLTDSEFEIHFKLHEVPRNLLTKMIASEFKFD